MNSGPWRRRTSGNTPGPTYMSKQQMGDFLNDLRTHRTQRPNGSRPYPQNSVRSSSYTTPQEFIEETFVGASRYSSLRSRTTPKRGSILSARTASGQSNTSVASTAESLSTADYFEVDHPLRQKEREEARAMRVALAELDVQDGLLTMVAEQDATSHLGDASRQLEFCEHHVELSDIGHANGRINRADGCNSLLLASGMRAYTRRVSPHAGMKTNTSLTSIQHLQTMECTASEVSEVRQSPHVTNHQSGRLARTPVQEQALNMDKHRSTSASKIANFALNHMTTRRRSSGSRTTGSQRRTSLFANPEDRIYEDPVEHDQEGTASTFTGKQQQQPRENVESARQVHMRRNPFMRVKSIRNSVSTPSEAAKENRLVRATVENKSTLRPDPSALDRHGPQLSEPGVRVAGAETAPYYEHGAVPYTSDAGVPNLSKTKSTTHDLALPIITPQPGGWFIEGFSENCKDPSSWQHGAEDLVPPPLRPTRSQARLAATDPEKPRLSDLPPDLSVSEQSTMAIPMHSGIDMSCPANKPSLESPTTYSFEMSHEPRVIIPFIPAQVQTNPRSASLDDISISQFPLPPSITVSDLTTERSAHQSHIPLIATSIKDMDDHAQREPLHNMPAMKLKPVTTSPQQTQRSQSHIRTAELCNTCGLTISGRSVTVSTARFHPPCFVCYHCQALLECIDFRLEPDAHRSERLARYRQQFHDQNDFHQSETSPSMPEACITPTKAESEAWSAANGDQSLRFYCHLDYHELFSPRCKTCKTPIEGKAIVACGAEWHEGHFFCTQCGDPFDAETPFVEKDGYAWCLNCHLNRFSPKCSKCRKPIEDNGVEAMGKEWHEQCFCCEGCETPFGDGLYFIKEDGMTTVCFRCEEVRLKNWA